MDGFPLTRADEEALELARLHDLTSAYRRSVSAIVGDACRQYPKLKESVSAVNDATTDLLSDLNGEIAQRDPDHAITSRRAPAAAE